MRRLSWYANFTRSCEVRLSSAIMKQVVGAPFEWLLMRNTEQVREVLFSHSVQWARDFIRTSIQLANDLVFAGFIFVALILASPGVGLAIVGVVTVIAAAIFAMVRPKLLRLNLEKRKAVIRAHVVSTETIRGIKDVKMAGARRRITPTCSVVSLWCIRAPKPRSRPPGKSRA